MGKGNNSKFMVRTSRRGKLTITIEANVPSDRALQDFKVKLNKYIAEGIDGKKKSDVSA